MIIREGTDEGYRCLLVNKETGNLYSRVKQFDTETKEAEVYVAVEEINDYIQREDILDILGLDSPKQSTSRKVATHNVNGVVTAKVTLRGAIALDRFTLEEMK